VAVGIEAGSKPHEGTMPFRVKHIDHVEVLVPDIGKTEAWYRKVLGLRRVQAWDPEPVMIGAGDTMLALFHSTRAKGRVPGRKKNGHRVSCGYLRVAFLIGKKGFERAQRRLKRLGIAYRGPVDHGTCWSVYFQDLNGLPLEITRPKR
jgi:catechol 2,3-dioxygenase-like lactoylglutathione lyase family enzyme